MNRQIPAFAAKLQGSDAVLQGVPPRRRIRIRPALGEALEEVVFPSLAMRRASLSLSVPGFRVIRERFVDYLAGEFVSRERLSVSLRRYRRSQKLDLLPVNALVFD